MGYVFSIHIPIALACLLAPMLGIDPTNLFLLPLHIVLLELIIDPTCSVVLERQPAERNIMERPPRSPLVKILDASGLAKSLLQGLVLFAASFGTYFAVLQSTQHAGAPVARAKGIAVIVLGNFLLVLVNSSRTEFVYQSAVRLMHDRVMWIVAACTMLGLLAVLYTPLSGFLKLAPLSGPRLLTVLVVGFIAVMWYELVKVANRIRRRQNKERKAIRK